MRLSYRRRLFVYFALIFVAFSLAAVVIEQLRQSRLKRQGLESQLEAYIAMIERGAIKGEAYQPNRIDSLLSLWPRPIRVSLLDREARVIYDNSVADLGTLSSHADRPEIRIARSQQYGSDIRLSHSNGIEYLYLARWVHPYYIRVALPYDRETKASLQADYVFLYWMLAWLVVMLWIVAVVSNHLGSSIRRLRDLALHGAEAEASSFGEDELGEISAQIANHAQALREQADEIAQERERLMQHVLHLSEGVGFFDRSGRVIFFNAPFLQHLNSIANVVAARPEELLRDSAFADAARFIAREQEQSYEETLRCHGRSYDLRINRFEDGSYEMLLTDTTDTEQMHQLKREMTSNISHELRTPITSIRGYLETCLTTEGLDEALRTRFLTQAHQQTLVLSDLIRDIGLLAKIDEAAELFEVELVSLDDLREQLTQEFAIGLAEQQARLIWQIPEGLEIRGNRNLLYSIWRNLIENALAYAGTGIEIGVQLYQQDEHFYYFCVYDTGRGIPEDHLVRIFERFYRCNPGRTRQTGGTGLGLSIVKHAVLFHRGAISAKNRASGGLEIIFRIARL
ncbi:MAG: ATP-binding protein [Porphyromonadaceae bacterium]|nr:ATP-binding protein [Porphyromonadaceae bacterium]